MHYVLILVPLFGAFLALFVFGPSAVGEWVVDRVNGFIGHIRVAWFREENREIGIIAIIVSLIVVYKIVLSAKR